MTAWPDPDTPTEEVRRQFDLSPLPGEGGFWGPGPRTEALSTIRFLVTDGPGGVSALHALTVTEGWQWLAGAPAELVQLRPDGSAHSTRLDAAASQVIVQPGTWMGARTSGAWTLASCWCTPAFEFERFSLGSRAELLAAYPEHAELVRAFTFVGIG